MLLASVNDVVQFAEALVARVGGWLPIVLFVVAIALVFIVTGAILSVAKLSHRKPQSLGFGGMIVRSAMSAAIFSWMFVRLVAFACILLPAFIRVGWWYFNSKHVFKSIKYGDKIRQDLDIYVPESVSLNKDKGKKYEKTGRIPTLIFTGGGAWIVGHKAFCALLGKIFMNQDVIVVAPDYRQFPQVVAEEMLQDIDKAIQWTFDNIHNYGGDRDAIFLAGQSAGAHLTSTLVLEHVRTEYKEQQALSKVSKTKSSSSPSSKFISSFLGSINEDEEGAEETLNSERKSVGSGATKEDVGAQNSHRKMSAEKLARKLHAKSFLCQKWKISQISGYIGISGPYHLPQLREHLFDRGIEQLSFLTHIVGGENTNIFTDEEHAEVLGGLSPALRLRRGTFQEMKIKNKFIESSFPPILLIHGDSDNVVPKQSTREFAKSLRGIGAKEK